MNSKQMLMFLCVSFVVKIYSLSQEVDENHELTIKCGNNQVIQIDNALWQYDRANIKNMFTPNVRNMAYLWGPYVGVCTWNVKDRLSWVCDHSKGDCKIKPTRKGFGECCCGLDWSICCYNMFLKVDYTCVDCPNNRRRRRSTINSIDSIAFKCEQYYGFGQNIKRFNTCPHVNFIDKHIMNSLYENSEAGARAFAHMIDYRRLWQLTSVKNTPYVQSLFYTPSMSYEERGDLCFFAWAARKYQCTWTGGDWHCRAAGIVRAFHNKNLDGHYMQELDVRS